MRNWLSQAEAEAATDGSRLTTVGRPSIGERDLVVEFLRQRIVTSEESEQQVAARRQHSLELGEHDWQLLRLCVDDGVESENAAKNSVGEVQGGRRPRLEPQVRMLSAGQGDHRGGQVDAEGGRPERVQVCRHVAGATSDVGDRSGVVGLHKFGEHGQQGTFHRFGLKHVTETLGVEGRNGVVGSLGVVQGGGFGHGGDHSLLSVPHDLALDCLGWSISRCRCARIRVNVRGRR